MLKEGNLGIRTGRALRDQPTELLTNKVRTVRPDGKEDSKLPISFSLHGSMLPS